MSTEPFFNKEQTDVLELVGSLMENSMKATHTITNDLMEGYQEDAKRARAEIKLIRLQVTSLFASGYMPTESAIMNALYPDYEAIDEMSQQKWI